VADVFGAVMANRATFGMVLLEQGDSGVLAVTRSLLRESSLRVVGEVVHDARFALYAKAALSAVRRVRARPGVLRLCAGWLADVLAGTIEMDEVELDPHGSHTPWEGVVELPEHETTAYLVEVDAKPHAALQLLASAPDSLSEYARSLVLAKARTVGGAPSGHDKSLLLFSTSSDSPGSLAQILAVFHEQGVNLRSIQSYASLQDAHMTDFFLEADGHEADGHFGSALRCLQAKRLAVNVKVLGSFAITASNLAEPLTPGGSLHGDARID
jgi:prephenate dehydratase